MKHYDKLPKNFGQDGIQLHYQDTDSMVMSFKTKNLVHDLDKLQDQYKLLDFCNLSKDHKLFSNEFKKKLGYLKIETPKSLDINKFVCLRSKCYAYNTELDRNDNILKEICRGYRKKM